MGINPGMTNTHQYVSGIVDKYRESLVGERITAIVDGLISEKSVQAQADAPCKCEAHAWREMTAEPIAK